MINPYVQQMFNLYKSSSNPQGLLASMMNSNPRMKQVMDYVNANGGDAQAAFYKMAKERGVDPEEILSQLR